MSLLALRLSGPLQSWGSRSRFTDRDTEREPTRSGVIGMLCAALGLPRDTDLRRFESLRMAVRVDRQGTVIRDFHTAQNVRRASGSTTGDQAVISNRFYLADAVFLVLLEGEREFLATLDAALANPVWPLFLGRKSCPPSEPVRMVDGLLEGELHEMLARYPRLAIDTDRSAGPVRCVVEHPEGEEARVDVPLSFAPGNRQYDSRRVKTVWVDLGAEHAGEGES